MSASSERIGLRLRHVIENVDSINAYVAGRSADALVGDQKTVDAIERCMQRVTEALIQIGEADLRKIGVVVPLADVRSMGNQLRHAYAYIDLDVILATIRDDLPPLRAAAARALEAARG